MELVEGVVAHERGTRERKGSEIFSFLVVHSGSTQYLHYVLRLNDNPVKYLTSVRST